MPDQTPLNPDAMRTVRKMAERYAKNRGVFTPDAEEIAERAIRAYRAVAQPVVNSVEDLDALPEETVIRSWLFGVVRERFDSGWGSPGTDEFESSDYIAGRDHVVLYRPEVER